MVSLTASELRERFECRVSDTALDDIIAAEKEAIESLYGADDTASETFNLKRQSGLHAAYQRDRLGIIVLHRKATVITSVTEVVGDETTVLAADDYELLGGMQLRRLSDGTNSRYLWGDQVTVEYTPEDDTALRKQVLIKLCQLNLAENGYLIMKTPEYTLQAIENFSAARAQALRRLRKRPLLV